MVCRISGCTKTEWQGTYPHQQDDGQVISEQLGPKHGPTTNITIASSI